MNYSESALKQNLCGIEILCDEKSLFNASCDNSRYSFKPFAVVKPKNCEEISAVLKFANTNKIPVSVRGSGSGCCANSLNYDGGLVLDTSKIDFINIDEVSWIAHVGAGAINAKIDAKANEYGLSYPPDPSSKNYSTIAGNIACNAGGLRAAKYGTTRDYVLALKICTATGEILELSRPLKKFVAGLNLKDLVIGSEGTLCVIAEAWLKLIKKPENRITTLAYFKSDNKAFKCVQEILSESIMPSVLEFMDETSVRCAATFTQNKVENAAMLLIELDGTKSEILESQNKLKEVLKEEAFKFEISEDEKHSEKLWAMRRACSPAMFLLNNTKINQDVVLPLNKTAEFFDIYKSLAKENGLIATAFGHAADGNYHIHFMYDSSNPTQKDNAQKAMHEAIHTAIKLGGAISGEHGIGLLKAKYLASQISATQIEIMKSIKKVFDPNNILNPHTIFNNIDFSKENPIRDLKLPWDKH